MKPSFQDFDKTNQGYISKNQFVRILNQFQLFPDEPNLNLLLKRYIDRGNLNEVNYFDFIRDIDYNEDESIKLYKTHAEAFKSPQKNHNNFEASIYNDKPNDLESLLNKIRRKVKE